MNFIHGELLCQDGKLVFHEKGGATKCTFPSPTNDLDAFIGKRVVLGVRPEDIEIAAHSRAEAPQRFDATVDLVEPLGSETNLYLKTGAHTITSRSQVAFDHSITGKNLVFSINSAKVHLFDPDTTNRIGL